MTEAGVPSGPHATRPWIDRAARSWALVGATFPRESKSRRPDECLSRLTTAKPLDVSVNAMTDSPASTSSRRARPRRGSTLRRLMRPPLRLFSCPQPRGRRSTSAAASRFYHSGELGCVRVLRQGGLRDGQSVRALRERAGSGAVRAAHRALPAGARRHVPARQGLRRADGRAALCLLRGAGVPRPRSLQGGGAQRGVHGDRQGRDGDGRPLPRARRGRLVTQPDAPRPLPPEELGFERIVYEKAPPRATITLNRPEILNAFDYKMLREIARACEDASYDDEIRVVVVTGAGRAFCVGANLKEWAEHYVGKPNEYWKWFGAFKDMHDRLREIGKPTLARINGIAVGGGNELQMACDLAVMVDGAYIRHVGPEHGSVPAGGATQWLTIMVGDRRAREIVLMCEEIPAAKAAEWGLVNSAVPRDGLDAEVDRLVESLTAKLPQTVRYTKQQLNFWRDLSWHETVNHARDWLALSMATDEPREAMEKFLSRKKDD